MKIIKIILNSADDKSHCYHVCGHKIISNQRIHSLSAFSMGDSEDLPTANVAGITEGEVVFKGTSWLAEKNREISCRNSVQSYVINVPEISRFLVSHDGSAIHQLPSSEQQINLTAEQLEYTLLGPPFMLALAINGYFGLHASSVEIANKAVLFAGESGYGKSTMARHLQTDIGLKRLSDDISVISKATSSFVLNADFPQLKLSDQMQTKQADSQNLGAIVILNRQQENVESKLVRLDSMNAIEVLLNHSVAAQLFDKALIKRHLEFLVELSAKTPVYQLNYQSGSDKINTIAKILRCELD